MGGGTVISNENNLDIITALEDRSRAEKQGAGGERVKELRGQSFPEGEYYKGFYG